MTALLILEFELIRLINFNHVDVDSAADVATYYDLVSNITHSSAAGTAREETTWKAQVHLKLSRDDQGRIIDSKSEDDEKWFQIQDLTVDEINRGMISLGESYIQVSFIGFMRRLYSLLPILTITFQIWERRVNLP